MEPGRRDADEQSGQKYQMHDSYLEAEKSSQSQSSTRQRSGTVNAAHGGGEGAVREGFLHGCGRHRVDAAATAVAAAAIAASGRGGGGGGVGRGGGASSREKAAVRLLP